MTNTVMEIVRKGRDVGVLIDAEDLEKYGKYKWNIDNEGYVTRTEYLGEGRYKKRRLHREIMNAPDDMEVDHINGNPLDNRRCNLRICTPRENSWNRGIRSDNTTGYKGVFRKKGRNAGKMWYAKVGHFHTEYFETKEEAANAYDYYALKFYGEFARLNNPDKIPTKPPEREQTSKHKGVWWCKRDKVWRVQFQHNKVRYNVGTFQTEEDAVEAYHKKRKEVVDEGDKENGE